ncbi:MAG: hypothetical protein ACI8ZM_000494 [Crocinitomix sp.]|jgi:hypothetical protein
MSDKIGKGRVILKEYFESDKMPTEGDFEDLVDSSLNKTDDQLFIKAEGDEDNPARFLGIGSVDPKSPLSICNKTGDSKRIGFEDAGGDEEWHISINPEEDNPGFLIQNNDKSDVALILDASGRVGIGTKQPEEDLHVDGKVKADEFIGSLDWNSLANIPVSLFVPKGIIVMWSGAINEIPTDWTLCDGKNGSPDLQDRFIVSAGKSYDTNSSGDPDIHNHQVNIPKKSLQTNSAGSHSHMMPSQWYARGVDSGKYAGVDTRNSNPPSVRTQNDGSHSHSIELDIAEISSSNYQGDNKPKWYALAFIMKT